MKNKKRILTGLLAAALVVPLFAGSAQTAAAAEAAGKTLDVVFTHDTHSHLNSFSTVIDGESTEVGGFARIKTVIDEQKAENPDTLVVDGGDFSMGTLVQTVYEDEAAELRMLGAIGCEVTNYRHPKTNAVDITINKPYENNSQPIKIVAVSDIHLGYGTGKSALKKYVDMINEQKPDLILIGGDLIDNSVVPLYTEKMSEELSELKAPMGIYMVPGNHEYISGIDESARFIKSTPIQLLIDSVVTLPNGIQLIGRDDRHNPSRRSLQELMENIDKSRPIILLDHQPYNLTDAEAAGIDLQFSGHTHHGQVWPMSLVTDYIYEQSHGYRQWGDTHIYVSSGLSLWGPPFRIGTESEMVVFELSAGSTDISNTSSPLL